MEIWVFLAKKITQKPASQYHPGTLLAVLVRYYITKSKSAFSMILKTFNNIVTKLKKNSMEFSTVYLPDAFRSITAKATGLILSLFDVASSGYVPFGIPFPLPMYTSEHLIPNSVLILGYRLN